MSQTETLTETDERAAEDALLRRTICDQIGTMNVAAISGLRVGAIPDGILLPVSHGYAVEVVLDRGSDTYIVRRTFTRAGKRTVKGERTMVYCDEVGEVAYRAGMFRSWDADEWPVG